MLTLRILLLFLINRVGSYPYPGKGVKNGISSSVLSGYVILYKSRKHVYGYTFCLTYQQHIYVHTGMGYIPVCYCSRGNTIQANRKGTRDTCICMYTMYYALP